MTDKQKGSPIELTITDLAFGGEGVGRLDGQVHFVAGAYPGERVLVLPVRGRKRWQRARLLKILEASPERIPPRCSHTEICGGCTYQTLAYPMQLEAKAHQVRENLARIAGLEPPEPEPPMPAPLLFGYRNKMEFSFSPRSWDPAGIPEQPVPGPALGLHVRGRFDAIFDIHDCVLCEPEVSLLLERIREFARGHGLTAYHGRAGTGLLRHLVFRSSRHSGEWLLALVVKEDDPLLADLVRECVEAHPRIAGFLIWIHSGLATVACAEREILVSGRNRIVERLVDLEFELGPSSFFQTNTCAAEVLLQEVRRMAPQVGTILDLYCGVGTLGLGLASNCNRMIGIESIAAAVMDARRNAERNGISHATFETAKAEDWLPRAKALRPDLVVVDPPRAGLHPRALSSLISLSSSTILYVSCNPATLARDLQALNEEGYRPDRLRILDLFPHTPHVETIVRLRR
jgi:23S rRNA (uracil1939-C5)-methyltransferase